MAGLAQRIERRITNPLVVGSTPKVEPITPWSGNRHFKRLRGACQRRFGIRCEAVECDELWTFIQKKEAMLTREDRQAHPEYGDTYTYVALDPVTKLIPTFHVGKRDSLNTHAFIADLSRRIEGSVQVSTDAWGPYSPAISRHFGNRATYAQNRHLLVLPSRIGIN
ncbi:MAG: hypothetical protein ACREJU_02875 [Nitrospiraceae bacterium]